MQVYAHNERQAKENVAANGWKIVSIRQLTYKKVNQIPIHIGDDMPTTVTLGPDGSMLPVKSVPDGKEEPENRMTNEEIIMSLLGPPKADAVLPPSTGKIPGKDDNGNTADGGKPGAYIVESDGSSARGGDGDLLGITPDSDQLEHLFTVYFELGVIEPTLRAQDIAILNALDESRKYYLFGHTDDVVVIDNPYYKDNFELSFKRAEAIKALMANGGINPANTNTVGLAYLYPKVENRKGPGGTPENRRVEVYGLR